MLFRCNTFRIFGDGSDKMILIATNTNGKQQAFIIHNPMINSLTVTNEAIPLCCYNGDQIYTHGRPLTTLELTANECELHEGVNLDKQFDPTWTKSVRELFSIINNKLDKR